MRRDKVQILDEIKRSARAIVPPAIPMLYHLLQGGKLFRGDFATWRDALRHSDGYDKDVILQKVKAAALEAKASEAVFERDSVVLEKPAYPYPILAWLLRIAMANGGRLNVLDFGGALGSSYFQCRAFLRDLEAVRWNVIEQRHVVSCGKQHFEDDRLRFHYSIDECLQREKVDVVLLSAVVQYLEDPHAFLADLATRKLRHIIVDRTPVVPGLSRDTLKVQRVPKEIYPASYPVWFLERRRFVAHFSENYRMLAEFDSFESWQLGWLTLQHVGFVFQERKDETR